MKLIHSLTSCKNAELASRYKLIRREPGRYGKIFRDHRQDGYVPFDGTGNLARWGSSKISEEQCIGTVDSQALQERDV